MKRTKERKEGGEGQRQKRNPSPLNFNGLFSLVYE
jgi:hypothetical protein